MNVKYGTMKKQKIDLIRKAINDFSWDRALENLNVNEMVYVFNRTLKNILSNFIPHETIICDDREPPWINSFIKKLINEKNFVYKAYIMSNKNYELLIKFQLIQNQLSSEIEKSKNSYYSRIARKLISPNTSPKAYWSILKRFMNNKKVPCIPPLFHENKFITDFKEKADVFNLFFSDQCSLIKNSSRLPSTTTKRTEHILSTVNFSVDDIRKIIQNLNPNKAHGFDMISIRMLQICGASICKPLDIIFRSCIKTGEFPAEWKKANVIPVHKKGDKQTIKNYRPISLLPICGKIFERLLFNEMFKFFIENDLISPNQSGFRPGDSCINQLLSITHDIYKSFDNGFEVRGVFLDISKAFDKVWHDGVLFKLQQNGISGNLLKVLTNFLSNRKQRVVLNGQNSVWTNIEAGVPQGSILGPLLFLIYINDLSDNLASNPKLFADDTSLFSVVENVNVSSRNLNNDLQKITDWAHQWKMNFNPDPTKQAQEVVFSRKTHKQDHPTIFFNQVPVLQVNSQKHLGLILDTQLSFKEHLKNILNKANKTIGLLRKLQSVLPRAPLVTIYKSYVRPLLDYGDVIYDQTYNSSFHQMIEKVQYNAALSITGAIRGTSREKLYQELGFESLQQRRWYRKLCFLYKIIKNQSPNYLFRIIPNSNRFYLTRNSDKIQQLKANHNYFKNSFFPSTISEWNKLDACIRNSESIAVFKKSILKFIRPLPNKVFSCHNPEGLRLITRLRLGLSHLREHKFKHSFEDSLNPLCICGSGDIESTSHYLLHCSEYSNERMTLLNKIRQIDSNILDKRNSEITRILLFGDPSFNDEINTLVLNTTFDFLISTKRFDEPLMKNY